MRITWILVASALMASACNGGGSTDRAATILSLSGDETAGASVFASHCAVCHGADGTGGTGSDLTANAFTEDHVVDVVLNGGATMAPLPQIADQDIADVAAFVLGL